MEGWNKLQSSLGSINLAQAGSKFTKGFNSSVQATRERFGQIAPEDITELPQGNTPTLRSLNYTQTNQFPEYKDLEARVDALRNAHLSVLKYVVHTALVQSLNVKHRIARVYEHETYDYPTQIQESISELSSSISYNLTSFAAQNLKNTNLPAPTAPAAPPEIQHKTLPHALTRAATSAHAAVANAAGGDQDKLGKALALYAQGWDRIATARLDQDAVIQDNFLHPWQTTLSNSISVAMKARQAVKVSRLELDAAKQAYVGSLTLWVAPADYWFYGQFENRKCCKARASAS